MKRETLHITPERGRRKRPNRNNVRRRTEQKHNERFREWEQQTAGYCTDERQPQSNTSCHAAAGTETQEALYQQITHSQSVLTQTDTKTQYLLRGKKLTVPKKSNKERVTEPRSVRFFICAVCTQQLVYLWQWTAAVSHRCVVEYTAYCVVQIVL